MEKDYNQLPDEDTFKSFDEEAYKACIEAIAKKTATNVSIGTFQEHIQRLLGGAENVQQPPGPGPVR